MKSCWEYFENNKISVYASVKAKLKYKYRVQLERAFEQEISEPFNPLWQSKAMSLANESLSSTGHVVSTIAARYCGGGHASTSTPQSMDIDFVLSSSMERHSCTFVTNPYNHQRKNVRVYFFSAHWIQRRQSTIT